jgi:hypothetical protein
MSKPLSPQAQAVDRAIAASIQLHGEMIHARHLAAAALCAAADQVVPDFSRRDRAYWSPFAAQIRAEWLAIAAELKAGG